MKIFVEMSGDRSVGIPDEEITIDWPNLEDWAELGDRKEMREHLIEFFLSYSPSNKVGVRFEDECYECGKQMTPHGQCENPRCFRNFNTFGEEYNV